jgi:hypothetical protein
VFIVCDVDSSAHFAAVNVAFPVYLLSLVDPFHDLVVGQGFSGQNFDSVLAVFAEYFNIVPKNLFTLSLNLSGNKGQFGCKAEHPGFKSLLSNFFYFVLHVAQDNNHREGNNYDFYRAEPLQGCVELCKKFSCLFLGVEQNEFYVLYQFWH